MARGTRNPTARNDSAGPGRPRQRAAKAASPTSATEVDPGREVPVWRRGLRLTRRALVLGLVLVVLALSFVSSLRLYLGQQHDLAVAEQEIRDRSAQIADLQAELARWEDPDYVKAQARDKLGWVMPGETGYRVIGADGKPLGGGVVIESAERLPSGEHDPTWWDRLWGSIQAADAPARKVSSP